MRKEDDYFRLGKKGNKDRPRPIIIKFLSFWRKKEIISRGSKLKGTDIFLSNDWSQEDAAELKELRKEMKDLKGKGHVVKIRGLTLMVDGKPWRKSENMEIDQTAGTPSNSGTQPKRQISPQSTNNMIKEGIN